MDKKEKELTMDKIETAQQTANLLVHELRELVKNENVYLSDGALELMNDAQNIAQKLSRYLLAETKGL